jgi:two-component system, response regulator
MTGLANILLVEDNTNDIELALHALRQYRLGESVAVVRDGADALEYVFCTGKYAQRRFADAPQLVLLDLKLPKVDGKEVLRALKADARTRAIPVVALTSSREEVDIAESYSLGVNSYIVKPIDFDQYTEALHQIGAYWLGLNEHGPQAL